MAKKGNSNLVPEARDALDKFKMEAAGEVGVNLKQGYNGDLTSRQAENYERRPPSASNCTRRAPPVYLSRRKNNEFRYAFGGTFFRSPYAASDNECLFPTRRPLPDTA